jgi:uncharacterized phage-like protein YoqJ
MTIKITIYNIKNLVIFNMLYEIIKIKKFLNKNIIFVIDNCINYS